MSDDAWVIEIAMLLKGNEGGKHVGCERFEATEHGECV